MLASSLHSDLYRYLSVAIIPLKNNLDLDRDKARYLPTKLIKKLNVSFHTYGFHGEIAFSLPFNRYKEALWDKLQDEQSLWAFEIEYIHALPDPQSKKYLYDEKAKWKIQAYVDINETAHSVFNEGGISNRSYYLDCNFKFADALCVFAKQVAPKTVFVEQKYDQVWEALFKDLKTLLNIDIAKSEKKKSWIAVNCDERYSLYDYFMTTAKAYRLELVYQYVASARQGKANYKLQKYSDYKIALENEQKKKDALLFPSFIAKMSQSYQPKVLGDYQFNNQYWNHTQEAKKTKESKSTYPFDGFYRQFHSGFANTSLFEGYFSKKQTQITAKRKYTYTNALSFLRMPEKISIMPSSVLQLKLKRASKSYIPKEQEFVVRTLSWSYANMEVNVREHDNDSFASNYGLGKKALAKKFDAKENDIFAISSESLTVESQIVRQEKLIANSYDFITAQGQPIEVFAYIYAAKDEKSRNHFLYEKKGENKRAKIDSAITNPDAASGLTSNITNNLFYHVNLPEKLLDPKSAKKTIILPYRFDNDHSFIPLKHMTPVRVHLYQEQGEILESCWLNVNTPLAIAANQHQELMTLGGDHVTMTHAADANSVDKGTFSIQTKTGEIVTDIQSKPGSFSLVYKKDKGGGS